MARMIPPRLAPETPDSERRVYQRFEIALPSTWTVIHSQRFLLPRHRRTQEGELDFLVLDPSRGAIGLEVKGGWVQRTAAGWSSIATAGRTKSRIRGSRRAAPSTLANYWEQAAGFGGRGFRCGYGWGVVLPDIECPGDLGPDLPRDVIGSQRLDGRKRPPSVPLSWQPENVSFRRRRQGAGSGTQGAISARFQPRPCSRRTTKSSGSSPRSRRPSSTASRPTTARPSKVPPAPARPCWQWKRRGASRQSVLLLCFNEPLARDLSQQADGDVETFHGFGRRPCRAGRTQPAACRITFYAEEAPMMLRLEPLSSGTTPSWWTKRRTSCPTGGRAWTRRCGAAGKARSTPSMIRTSGSMGVALPKRWRSSNTNWSTTAATPDASPATWLAWSEPVKTGAPEGRPVERITCNSSRPVEATGAQGRRRLRRNCHRLHPHAQAPFSGTTGLAASNS